MCVQSQNSSIFELEYIVRTKVAAIVLEAKGIWGDYLKSFCTPEIRFDIKSRNIWGEATPEKHLIRFNMAALKSDPGKFCQITVVHEMAHLITHQLYGPRTKPHGKEWKMVMVLLGAKPDRCYDFPDAHKYMKLKPRKKVSKSYVYVCSCRTHHISAVLHNRYLRGIRYHCRFCGGDIKPYKER